MQSLEAAEHYHRLILFAYAVYAVVLGAVLSMRDEGAGRRLSWSFIAISLIALASLRLPAIFPNVAFDPDEAQYLAAAIKLAGNANSWASVDINSSGPLNAYPLMWPFAFGLVPGFALAHLTGLAVLAATWLMLLFAMRWAPRDIRVFLGAAMIVLIGGMGTSPVSLLSFSSELVPSLLMMVGAAAALAAATERPPLARFLFAALCLGAVPFAKLQGVVVALMIGLILLVQTFRTQAKPWRAVAAVAVAAGLPAALILGPLAATGHFSDFWTSYILSGEVYSQAGFGKVSGDLPPQILALYRIILPREIKDFVLSLTAATALAAIALVWKRPGGGQRSVGDNALRPEIVRCVVAALILAAGVAAAAAPARPFPHYAYFFLWPATLFAASIWTVVRSRGVGIFLGPAPLTAALGAVVIGATAIGATAKPRIDLHQAEKLTDPAAILYPVELLPRVNGEAGPLLVWGWAPEYYVWSGRRQATRESLTYFQIWDSPIRDAYRQRMMSELRNAPPDYVIDAVGPGNFHFEDREKEGVGSFAELRQFLADRYTSVSSSLSGSSCPRIYASRAAMAAFAARYVPPVGATFSGGSNSRTDATAGEDDDFQICFDTAALASDQHGAITLDLGRLQPVSGVEFLDLPRALATVAGETAPQANLKAQVEVLGPGAAPTQTVVVPPYPRWIVAQAGKAAPADKIVINVEGGSGGFLWTRVLR